MRITLFFSGFALSRPRPHGYGRRYLLSNDEVSQISFVSPSTLGYPSAWVDILTSLPQVSFGEWRWSQPNKWIWRNASYGVHQCLSVPHSSSSGGFNVAPTMGITFRQMWLLTVVFKLEDVTNPPPLQTKRSMVGTCFFAWLANLRVYLGPSRRFLIDPPEPS